MSSAVCIDPRAGDLLAILFAPSPPAPIVAQRQARENPRSQSASGNPRSAGEFSTTFLGFRADFA
jgi:hypothetical protein